LKRSKKLLRNAGAKRCLIPADGFYEWQGAKGKKPPVYLTLPSQETFAFAVLWETRMPKNSDGSIHKSCAIITTTASESVVPIHHRMPVILKPEKYAQWLDPELSDLDELKDIISNWIVTKLVGEAVSRQVNSAQNNDPSNIKPLTQMQIDF
jgi:putative SOS response-associated peptidase YedK